MAEPVKPVISPAPSPPPVKTSLHERVAATGSVPASEDAQSAGARPRHRDPQNGAIGRAQALGGSDAIVRRERGERLDD